MCENVDLCVSAPPDGTVVTLIATSEGIVKLAQAPDMARWFAQELLAAADRSDGRKAAAEFEGGSP